MKNSYNLAEWAKETTLGRHVFNYNFQMFGNEISGWELIDSIKMANDSGTFELIYMLQKISGKGKEIIRMGISEQNSWKDAHLDLKSYLDNCTHPNIPRGKTSGDISFANSQPDAKEIQAVVFTRGNMRISLNSVGDNICDVSKVASKIDQLLHVVPKLSPAGERITSEFRKKETKIKKQSRFAVVEAISRKGSDYGWVKVISPDGELIKEGDSLIYKPDTIGKKDIAIFLKKDNEKQNKIVLDVAVL